MRHILRHIGPVLGLLLLAACDTGSDASSRAPDRNMGPSAGNDQPPQASQRQPTPTQPQIPAGPLATMNPAAPTPNVPPAVIRVAEDGGASGQSSSRTLSSDQRRLPLTRILAIAAKAVPGEVISVELDADEDDGPEYEVKILTPQGRMIEMEIAARSGNILKIEDD